MLKNLFFRSGIFVAICGVLLIVAAFTTHSRYYWEPGTTGAIYIINSAVFLFVAYCMRLSGLAKWSAIASGTLMFAGLCLQTVTQAARLFFDILLIDWRVTEALFLSGLEISLALLAIPFFTVISRRLADRRK